MDWEAVALTLIAVGGTLAATQLANRHARKEREAAEVRERSRRIAEPMGRVRIILLDLEPMRMAANMNDTMRPVLVDATRTWNGLREELSIAAAVDGTRKVMDMTSKLTLEVSNLINRVSVVMSMQTNPSPGVNDWRPMYEQAQEHYLAANLLARTLLDHVHGGASGGQSDETRQAEEALSLLKRLRLVRAKEPDPPSAAETPDGNS